MKEYLIDVKIKGPGNIVIQKQYEAKSMEHLLQLLSGSLPNGDFIEVVEVKIERVFE